MPPMPSHIFDDLQAMRHTLAYTRQKNMIVRRRAKHFEVGKCRISGEYFLPFIECLIISRI